MMLEKIPTTDEMTTLVGQDLYDVWQKLCTAIDEKVRYGVSLEQRRQGVDLRIQIPQGRQDVMRAVCKENIA